MGPKTTQAPQDEADNGDVVLPEIEPATVDSSGLKMRDDEQKRLWEEAAKNALGYLDHLPNFRCTAGNAPVYSVGKVAGSIKRGRLLQG